MIKLFSKLNLTNNYIGVIMEIKQLCKELQVKLQPIADELGYTLPYVSMVLRGKRTNTKITSAVFLAIEERKKELRKIIN